MNLAMHVGATILCALAAGLSAYYVFVPVAAVGLRGGVTIGAPRRRGSWIQSAWRVEGIPQSKEPVEARQLRTIVGAVLGVAVLITTSFVGAPPEAALLAGAGFGIVSFFALGFVWEARQERLRDRLHVRGRWFVTLLGLILTGAQRNPQVILAKAEYHSEEPFKALLNRVNRDMQFSVTLEDALQPWRDSGIPLLVELAGVLPNLFTESDRRQRETLHELQQRLSHDRQVQAEERRRKNAGQMRMLLTVDAAVEIFLVVLLPALAFTVQALQGPAR